MSIKNKFESIKQEVSKNRAASDIVETKKSVVELVDRKTVLSDKINNTQNILSKLESIFSQSEKSLIDFKTQKEQLGNLFFEYKDYLADKDINSVKDLLDNPEFAGEEEIKHYNEVKPGKNSKGDRGSLGKNIEEASIIKQEAKESLSDLDLDFRGGTKEGEETSPRKQSFNKIKNYIDQLKGDLEKLNSQEQKLKNENLPIIKELLEDNIKKVFSAENLSVGPVMENLNFIKDEVFGLCGDEFWPEAKKMAADLIAERYQERFGDKKVFGPASSENINKSLEMEKLIFDANDIRENHKELLVLNSDKEVLKNFIDSADYFRFQDEKIVMKDKKAYSGHILSQIEYFNQKNAEAKVICEEAIKEAKEMVDKLESEIPSKFLAGRDEKYDIEKFSNGLGIVKEGLEKINAPEYFHSEDRYRFYNNFRSLFHNLDADSRSEKKWALALVKEFKNKVSEIDNKIISLHNNESDAFSKLSDNIYQLNHRKFEKINDFKAPYIDVKETRPYQNIYDKADFDNFLDSLEGKELDKEQFEVEIDKRKDLLTEKIADYPNSQIILEKFNVLVDKYKKEFQLGDLNKAIQEKNYARNNKRPGYFKETDSYRFQKDLFYGEKI